MKPLHWLVVGAALFSSNESLGQSKPFTAGHFVLTIDGHSVSAKNVIGGGTPTEKAVANDTPLQITIDRTGSDAMWDWIIASINQGPVEKKLTAQAKGKRRATFIGAHIVDLKFSDLDASASKDQMQVTVTVVPKQISTAPEVTPTAEPAQKNFSPSNFRIKLGGLPLSKVHKIEAIAIKQKVSEDGKTPVFALDDVRINLDTSDAKTFADTLSKDKTKPLSIAFTNDDGSVWKTLTVNGVKIESSKATGASSSMTIKGSKIGIN